jgi:glutamyl-tRNA synthetase
MSVRVRYAPSPTGKQHIGGVRTALFNYFFARSQGGKFILRIEDTDRERSTPEALQDIYDTFAWLGIHWDEGPDVGGPFTPYVQSERFELYKKYAGMLVETGHAYHCYCSSERLEKMREEQAVKKLPQGYDRKCRSLTPKEKADCEKQGLKSVIRFKIPLEGQTVFHDELLGDIEKANIDINPDPVLLKSDGFPTYHLANIVDDHLMEITHVLRSQEWLSSVPIHVLLYKAFGWAPPKFCHLPMVMGEDGHKLSKRHGATSLIEFREKGYLAEALITYVSLLGWSYDDTKEFFTTQEFEKLFSLEKLTKSSAVFDYKKLDWFNGQYIRKLTAEELCEKLIPFLQKAGLIAAPAGDGDRKTALAMIPLIRERLSVLSEAAQMTAFLFQDIPPASPDELVPKKLDKAKTIEILTAIITVIIDIESKTDEQLEADFKLLGEKLAVKLGDLLMPLRVALTGSKVSPPLIGSLRILGAKSVIARIDAAIALLG